MSAALVLVVGAVSLLSLEALRDSYKWVLHTYRVLDAANDVLLSLTNAETGQRGFLLTGRESYLQPYLLGRGAVDSDLETLRQLTVDNPQAGPRIDSLAVLAHAKIAELDSTVRLRRERGPEAALAVVLTDQGRLLMGDARSVIADINDSELALLADRDRARQRLALVTIAIIVVGSLIAFILAAATINTIRVDVEQRERDRQQIEAQTVQLEEQAAELESQQAELEAQTEELRASNDELQGANERAERALRIGRLTQARLKRSNEELDQFAYVASHDLKAPLRGIANLATWLEEDLGSAVSGPAHEHMALLQGRVRRMEALIDGVLQYSRAGRERAPAQQVDVAALLADVVDLLAPPPSATIQVADGMPTLLAERIPLQQVFLNLIGNAIKHAERADVRVEVGVQFVDGVTEFSVADNGPGIAQEYHDRVFGIFQTLHARDKVESTGIGLSVVKKIVESHGGRVMLESAEGHGATFRFSWPTLQPEET